MYQDWPGSMRESVMLNVIYNKHETTNFASPIKGMRNEADNRNQPKVGLLMHLFSDSLDNKYFLNYQKRSERKRK